MPNTVLHTRIDALPRESIDGGILQRTAVRGDDSLVTVNWLAPTDSAPPPHSHPFDQLSFVLEGEMEFTVSGETYLVKAGEVLQIPADAPHTARTVSAGPALNYDVYAPVRKDYLHLVAHQADAFDKD